MYTFAYRTQSGKLRLSHRLFAKPVDVLRTRFSTGSDKHFELVEVKFVGLHKQPALPGMENLTGWQQSHKQSQSVYKKKGGAMKRMVL